MTSHPEPRPSPIASALTTPRRIDSREILHGDALLEICHAGRLYLLRVTRENKLILTR
jgi:hemin uptake protein HemP